VASDKTDYNILPHYYDKATTDRCVQGSVGIGLKELRGGVSCRNVSSFAQGLKFKADFYSKMSVCRHELGVQPQPQTIPTLVQGIIMKTF